MTYKALHDLGPTFLLLCSLQFFIMYHTTFQFLFLNDVKKGVKN